MSDEEFYLQATQETETGKQSPALWAKAKAITEGDVNKTKYQYIKLRVDQLKRAGSPEPTPQGKAIHQDSESLTTETDIPKTSNETIHKEPPEQGFIWWQTWAWLGLTIGNFYAGWTLYKELPGLSIILIIINTVLMIMILYFNKYAFLTATILSFNPIIWIANGIYLKNRWNHPRINRKPSEATIIGDYGKAGHKGFCEKCGIKTTINHGTAYLTLCKNCAKIS